MKLLIIKSGRQYIRFKNETYFRVKFEKASVFPFDDLDLVKEHAAATQARGFENICIRQLTITEEDLQ